jgi:hypothetical protein
MRRHFPGCMFIGKQIKDEPLTIESNGEEGNVKSEVG